jgi:hypothetical protein
MATWNGAFELTPSATDKASEGDDRIREIKTDVRSRIGNEHGTYANLAVGATGVATADWFHKGGSAVAYYQDTAPTQRPDASTTLGTNDVGRLWVDSDNKEFNYWDGSAWVNELALSALESSNTGGVPVDWDYRNTAGTEANIAIHSKIIEIGDWNMDSTASVNVAHGLTLSKITNVLVLIQKDDDSVKVPLVETRITMSGLDVNVKFGGSIQIGATNITLYRANVNMAKIPALLGVIDIDVYLTSIFDGDADYDSSSHNRGWVYIWYTD